MKSDLQKIVDLMYSDERSAEKVADLLDIPADPDGAAEYLTMLPDEQLKDTLKVLEVHNG